MAGFASYEWPGGSKLASTDSPMGTFEDRRAVLIACQYRRHRL
jgi:hypothetical protein